MISVCSTEIFEINSLIIVNISSGCVIEQEWLDVEQKLIELRLRVIKSRIVFGILLFSSALVKTKAICLHNDSLLIDQKYLKYHF